MTQNHTPFPPMPPAAPPFSFEVVVQSGRNPDGTHAAEFSGVAPNPKQRPDYAPSMIVRFQVASGPHAGTVLSEFVPQKVTPDNKTGKLLAGMLGRAAQAGERLGFGQFERQRFIVTVSCGKITSVVRAPQ